MQSMPSYQGIPSLEEQELVLAELLEADEQIETSLCGGWPIFGLLAQFL